MPKFGAESNVIHLTPLASFTLSVSGAQEKDDLTGLAAGFPDPPATQPSPTNDPSDLSERLFGKFFCSQKQTLFVYSQ